MIDVLKYAKERLKGATSLVYPTISEKELQDSVRQFIGSEQTWLQAAINRDPAIEKKGEEGINELLTYQGLHAIALHRWAHSEYNSGHFYEARRISQAARRITGGIEIHPGAKIGKNFFIDHGSGAVIGETARIGDDVFLYHGVTLGAWPGMKDATGRRHPIVGDNVTIGCETEILGTNIIGNNSTIGAGSKILGDVKIGKRVSIGAGVEILGDITIEDGVRIEAGAKIIGEKVRNGSEWEFVPIKIGNKAVIQADVLVKKDVPDGTVVVGSVPEIPGLIENPMVIGQPFLRKRGLPDTNVTQSFWQGLLQQFRRILPEGVGL